MIPSSPPLKVAALAVALAANGIALSVVLRPDPVRIEGGAREAAARLGSSFVDLASGSPLAPDAPQPLAPDVMAAPVTPDAPAQPASTTPVATGPDTEAEPERPTAAPPAVAEPTIAPSAPPAVADRSAVPAAPPLRRTPSASAMTQAPAETVTAEPTEPGVVLRSPRPGSRSAAFERAHRQARADTAPARQAPRGNADTSARAGTATGERAERAVRSSEGSGRSARSGTAAASNYPGEVMQRLSRIRRPSVRTTGTATVAFRVASSGGLASLAIARSSGSAALDREALSLVERAAPFPPPPAGAQSSFSINITGR